MDKFKVIMVHNFHKGWGGSDAVAANDFNLLKDHGIDVIWYRKSNLDINISNIPRKINFAVNSIWSIREYKLFTSVLRKEKPDIIHIHDTFPIISPSIFQSCLDNNYPLVQTLHDYRLICPNCTCYRKGNICLKCQDSLYQSVVNHCYHDSSIETLPVAMMVANNRHIQNKLINNAYICLTKFSKDLFVKAGIDKKKIFIRKNYLLSAPTRSEYTHNGPYLYIGRLTEDKGILFLLNFWRKYSPGVLHIYGDGPLSEEVRSLADGEKIKYFGFIEPSSIITIMKKAKCVIIPSLWFEGLPVVFVEACGAGVPVIASNIGSLCELVTEAQNGYLFSPDDEYSLNVAISNANQNSSHLSEMADNSYTYYLKCFTKDIAFSDLIAIYSNVISGKE